MEVKEQCKETELGTLPVDWNVKSIGDISTIDSDNLGSGTSPSYAFKYVSLENVEKGKLNGYSDQVFISAPSRARRRVKKNDILVSTVRPNLQSHLFVKDTISDLICSTGFSVVRCAPNLAYPNYVYFHLFAGSICKQIESLLSGSNYPSINSKDVRALRIPIPKEITEQEAIAGALSDIEALTLSLEKLIAKKRDIKTGTMQLLLTEKKRLHGFTGKWVEKKLGEVVGKITTGKLDANTMEENGKYRFYTCAKDYYFINEFAFDTEALLVSGNGANVGYIHYYKGKFNAYQRTYVLSDFLENIQFIKVFLDKNLQERIRVEVNAGNTPYITRDTLSEMTIMFPPTKEEQSVIAHVLGDMGAEIDQLEYKLNKYKMIKQGMMQQLLTGKTRLI